LVLVETNLPFRSLETFLDRPADPGDPHQRGEADGLRTPAAVERQLGGDVVDAAAGLTAVERVQVVTRNRQNI
jgi:hypothetical protein